MKERRPTRYPTARNMRILFWGAQGSALRLKVFSPDIISGARDSVGERWPQVLDKPPSCWNAPANRVVGSSYFVRWGMDCGVLSSPQCQTWVVCISLHVLVPTAIVTAESARNKALQNVDTSASAVSIVSIRVVCDLPPCTIPGVQVLTATDASDVGGSKGPIREAAYPSRARPLEPSQLLHNSSRVLLSPVLYSAGSYYSGGARRGLCGRRGVLEVRQAALRDSYLGHVA